MATGLVIAGHRDLEPSDFKVIDTAVFEFLGYDDFDELLFGGARGADTAALEAALRHRSGTRPRLIVVVPDHVQHQPGEAQAAIRRADLVIELKRPITNSDGFAALHRRNRFMIDWVAPEGRLLAFWNGKRSGTGNVVAYAGQQGVEVSRRDIIG